MLKTTAARLLALCTVTALASGCVAVPDNGYYDTPAYSTGYPQAYPQTYPSGPVYAPGVIYGPSVYPVAPPIYDGRRIDRERVSNAIMIVIVIAKKHIAASRGSKNARDSGETRSALHLAYCSGSFGSTNSRAKTGAT